MNARREGSQTPPDDAVGDEQVVAELFAAYAAALGSGEAEAIARVGRALSEAAAHPRPDAVNEHSSSG